MTGRRALLIGEADPRIKAIGQRLEEDGFLTVADHFAYSEAFAAQPPPAALILAPPLRSGQGLEALDAEAMVMALDESLIAAGIVVRDLVARHTAADTRIVVLAEWAAP